MARVLKFIKQYKILIIIILAVLVTSPLILVLILTKPVLKPQPEGEIEQSTPSAQIQEIPKDFSLSLGPQRVGIAVVLFSASVPKTSWLVVHSSKNGSPGEILEEAIPPLNPGNYEKNAVILRVPPKAGTYYASLHIDDGDLKFDPVKDTLAKDEKGQDIMKGFIAR